MRQLQQWLDAAASACRSNPDEAAALARHGLLEHPKAPALWDLLARVQLLQGRAEPAWDNYDQAWTLLPPGARGPDVEGFLLRRIVCADLSPDAGPDVQAELREEWRQRCAPEASGRARPRHPDPDRPLRVGVLSAQIAKTAGIASYRGLLELPPASGLEIFVYSDTATSIRDVVTEHVQRCVGDRWRDTAKMTNAAWARTIAEDRIDVLLDCLEYDGADRLRMLAERPAPVLVGHISGLRMPCLDFFLDATAPLAVPAIGYAPLVRGRLEARPERPFTYGYLGRPSKINAPVLTWWGSILRSAPATRLVLKDHRYPRSAGLREWILEGLQTDLARVTFLGTTDHLDHLNCYNLVDLALDSWPWTGGITTLEALHMGCPVVSLTGETFFARQGAGILGALDLKGLVAETPQAYMELAVAAAASPPLGLEERLELRGRLEGSELFGARYVANVARTLRACWKEACAWPV
jgi:predicted O-linked N-acetylglucosamine transferase (SPINDLY family)